MLKCLYHFVCIMALLSSLAFAVPDQKVKIWMAGDSTMCIYQTVRSPLTGWGMPFALFFDSSVQVINRAKGGRSTKTFIEEKSWQAIVDSLQEGDYVFIQFGHNDEAKEEQYKDRHTSVDDYCKNLRRFVEETRHKKAIPVLITPVSRFKFDAAGNALETHAGYTNAVYALAKQYNVALIDLDKRSRELYQQMGSENAKLLFMHLYAGEHPHYPLGQNDNTHFNEFGARKIAQLVYKEMKVVLPELCARVVKPKQKR